IVLGVLLLFTIFQPLLPNQYSPVEVNLNPLTGMQDRNHKPDMIYWFGTNNIGQDLWARLWSGTRTSLLIGIAVGLWNAVIGIAIGALWGYVRQLDRLITEVYNVLHNIPSTIILILASYILRPSVTTMIMAMCVTGWLPMARFVRNQIVIIRDREYNLASRCLGTPTGRLIVKNLLPYLVSVIMLRIALAIPTAIGQEVFLTYIGLGLPVSIPSLGNLINEGRLVMSSASYQLLFPAAVLSAITIAFYVMGNAFADAADPKNHV
ncbi:MAG: ABC transporter permease, partial [Oscillospiraceae bacterium]